jgi:polysaccharide export outer membrane protein
LLYGFAAAGMGMALIASLSRGGMISLAAALMFLILMSSRIKRSVKNTSRRQDWSSATGLAGLLERIQRAIAPASRILIVLAIAGAITAGLIWVGPDAVAKRITEGQISGSNQRSLSTNRVWVWRDTLSMIRANPVLGVGLGGYGTAFSIYTRSDGSIRVPQAHNDYLQVVADCGVIGGLIALWFLGLTLRAIWRGVRSPDPLTAGLALGCGGGVFAILVHSLFDFNLQLPGTALLFLVLSAVVDYTSATVAAAERSKTLAPVGLAWATSRGKRSDGGADRKRNDIMIETIRSESRVGRESWRPLIDKRSFLVLAVMILTLATGQGYAGTQKTQHQPQQGPGQTAEKPADSARSTPVLVSPEEDYRIGAGDVIDVQVEDMPEASRTIRVNAAGTFLMPIVGRMKALGRTPEALGEEIADKLRGDYLKDPKVSVFVREYNSRSFFIQGAVRNPGVFQIEGRPSLLTLITLAGGLAENHGAVSFIIRKINQQAGGNIEARNQGELRPGSSSVTNQTVLANQSSVTNQTVLANQSSVTNQTVLANQSSLANQTEPAGETATADSVKGQASGSADEEEPRYELVRVNINNLLRGNFSNNAVLQPGDIVNIPPSDVFYVAGEVRAPGSFALKEGTTLRQAVSLAQGTNYNAATDRAIIFRDDASGTRQEIPVDIGAVMRGSKEDVPIIANDIIIVPNSRMKSFSSALIKALGLSTVTRLPIP